MARRPRLDPGDGRDPDPETEETTDAADRGTLGPEGTLPGDTRDRTRRAARDVRDRQEMDDEEEQIAGRIAEEHEDIDQRDIVGVREVDDGTFQADLSALAQERLTEQQFREQRERARMFADHVPGAEHEDVVPFHDARDDELEFTATDDHVEIHEADEVQQRRMEDAARDRVQEEIDAIEDAPEHPTPGEVEQMRQFAPFAAIGMDQLDFQATNGGVQVTGTRVVEEDPADVEDELAQELAEEHGVDPDDIEFERVNGEVQATVPAEERPEAEFLDFDDFLPGAVSDRLETERQRRVEHQLAGLESEREFLQGVFGTAGEAVGEARDLYGQFAITDEEDVVVGEVPFGVARRQAPARVARDTDAAEVVGTSFVGGMALFGAEQAIDQRRADDADDLEATMAIRTQELPVQEEIHPEELEATGTGIVGTELDVGERIPQEELEATEPAVDELEATDEPFTEELETPEEPSPGVDTTFGMAPMQEQIGRQRLVDEEDEPWIITGEDIITDLPEPDQRGPSVREQIRRDDLFVPHREFPTGAGAVIGREAEFVEEAQRPHVTEEPGLDLFTDLDHAVAHEPGVTQRTGLLPGLGVEETPFEAAQEDVTQAQVQAQDTMLSLGLTQQQAQMQAQAQAHPFTPAQAHPPAHQQATGTGFGFGFPTAFGAGLRFRELERPEDPDEDDERFERIPEGEEFVNPIASGAEMLFGRGGADAGGAEGLFGVEAPRNDNRAENGRERPQNDGGWAGLFGW